MRAQVLAIRRGQKEGILGLSFSVGDGAAFALLRLLKRKYRCADRAGSAQDPLSAAVEEAAARLLGPSRQRAAWRAAVQAAEEGALAVFCRNLRSLLLTPPLSAYHRMPSGAPFSVLGVDPGFSNGHKLAVVAPFGSSILATGKLFSSGSKGKGESLAQLQELCAAHSVKVIAIGDGVGSREAQQLVEGAMRGGALPEDVACAVVSEAGASVYSVSAVAREQHPDVEISKHNWLHCVAACDCPLTTDVLPLPGLGFLGAASIARRLVDPLSELVKIPPGSLGIGQCCCCCFPRAPCAGPSIYSHRLPRCPQACTSTTCRRRSWAGAWARSSRSA